MSWSKKHISSSCSFYFLNCSMCKLANLYSQCILTFDWVSETRISNSYKFCFVFILFHLFACCCYFCFFLLFANSLCSASEREIFTSSCHCFQLGFWSDVFLMCMRFYYTDYRHLKCETHMFSVNKCDKMRKRINNSFPLKFSVKTKAK